MQNKNIEKIINYYLEQDAMDLTMCKDTISTIDRLRNEYNIRLENACDEVERFYNSGDVYKSLMFADSVLALGYLRDLYNTNYTKLIKKRNQQRENEYRQ